jgi:putative peptidoglycan lipid II flippase
MTVAGGLLLLALRRSAGPEALDGLPRVLLAGGAAAAIAGLAGRAVGVRLLDAVASGVAGSLLAGVVAGLVSGVLFVVLLAVFDRKDLTTVLQRLPAGRRRATTASLR